MKVCMYKCVKFSVYVTDLNLTHLKLRYNSVVGLEYTSNLVSGSVVERSLQTPEVSTSNPVSVKLNGILMRKNI